MTIDAAELELLGCPRAEEPEDAIPAESLGISAFACAECGREYPVVPKHVCDFCWGPLEIVYDYGYLSSKVSRTSIAFGPPDIWRYADLLPVPERGRVELGAGWTPLRRAERLGAELGLKKLWVKNDSLNPTNSFKDRVVSTATTVARFFGFDTIACASTGNLANSVAAHASAAGLRSVVFVPKSLETGKLAATGVFGGEVIAVDGSYDDANRLCAELAQTYPWAFVNVNLRAFYSEGSKTVAFEIAEQLGWRAPDAVVAPAASGSLLTKVGKGFRELSILGLIDESQMTSLFGGQAAGCSPIAAAFEAGSDLIRPVKPATQASSLAIGDPADGYNALEAVRKTGGGVVAVPEASIVDGIKLLARTEGIFTEGAGGVAVAALEQLVSKGAIDPDQETVVVITGHGLKTIDSLGELRPTHEIEPTKKEADRIINLEVE